MCHFQPMGDFTAGKPQSRLTAAECFVFSFSLQFWAEQCDNLQVSTGQVTKVPWWDRSAGNLENLVNFGPWRGFADKVGQDTKNCMIFQSWQQLGCTDCISVRLHKPCPRRWQHLQSWVLIWKRALMLSVKFFWVYFGFKTVCVFTQVAAPGVLMLSDSFSAFFSLVKSKSKPFKVTDASLKLM